MIYTGIAVENSGTVLLARVLKQADGTPITAADISAISVRVWNLDDTIEVTPAPTYTIGNIVYSSLQTDGRAFDDEGYNVAIPLSGSYLNDGGGTVQVEVNFTPATGNSYYAVWKLQVQNILSE